MSASNTSFPNPSAPVYSESNAPTEIAGSQPQGVSPQGSGLGVLVLPKGEVVTILPQAPSKPQIVTPESSELVNQGYTPTQVRVIPPAQVAQPRDSISFDDAIVNEIVAVRAEWREQSTPFQQGEDPEEEKKKKKYKKGRSKKGKGSSFKLSSKAELRFRSEKKPSPKKPEGLAKKKTKKTSAPSIFSKAKR